MRNYEQIYKLFKSIFVYFGKMWVALKKAGSVVELGGLCPLCPCLWTWAVLGKGERGPCPEPGDCAGHALGSHCVTRWVFSSSFHVTARTAKFCIFFSASTVRCTIFRQHVKNLTMKSLSDTWCECRIESVKAVRYQPVEIHEALSTVAAATTDPLSRSEAESLCRELETFSFIVALVFWHDILFQLCR